jgi:hypothetical protein
MSRVRELVLACVVAASCVAGTPEAAPQQNSGAIGQIVPSGGVIALTGELGAERFEKLAKLVKDEFEERKAHVVRSMVLDSGRRIDGRDTRTVRPISCEVGLLPRVHGSGLFQRGETQAIVTTTLGTVEPAQAETDTSGRVTVTFVAGNESFCGTSN